MSHPGRNDPCPCGSGRKYKACHQRADERAEQMKDVLGPEAAARLRDRTAEVARRTPVWEADVAPLNGIFSETGEPGSLVMVGADGLILTCDVVGLRPVGAAARARVVLDGVMVAARGAGVLPERLHVRDEALAQALRPELERRGITPAAVPIPELDEALEASLDHAADGAPDAVASSAWTWGETEAAPAALAEFHAATADYHRAAPWRLVTDAQGLLLRFPGDDAPWAAAVMGASSIHYGLALYSEPADLESLYEHEGEPSTEWARTLHGFSLSLSYDAAADLSPAMRREVQRAGWEVAGPDAYPVLLGIGVPGRRITAELVTRMAMACRAVIAFLAEQDDFQVPWRDPGTGLVVEAIFNPEGEEDHAPWLPLERSHPIGPAGPAADPAFVLRPEAERERVAQIEDARFRRYVAWLNGQGLSKAAHGRDSRVAETWSSMLRRIRVPAQAATEHELRFFLYGWLVMEDTPPKPVARHLTRSLRRLFAWYAAAEGIEYPWAEVVLAELDGMVERSGEEDVRDVLEWANGSLVADLIWRAMIPHPEVPGTVLGWSSPFNDRVVGLRDDLHRLWLLWHDEVVRGGVTDPRSVREILLGRQREWENRPNAALDGRTPREVVLEEDAGEVETLSRLGLLNERMLRAT